MTIIQNAIASTRCEECEKLKDKSRKLFIFKLLTRRTARRNSNGHFMLYTAGTRAIACLENVVHKRRLGSNDVFRGMLLEIPDYIEAEKVNKKNLATGRQEHINYPFCQAIGDTWQKKNKTAVIQAPSPIITEESKAKYTPISNKFVHPTDN